MQTNKEMYPLYNGKKASIETVPRAAQETLNLPKI